MAMPIDASGIGPAELLDALDVGLIVLDEDSHIIGWNEWIARASGRSRVSVLGKRLSDVFPETLRTRLPSSIADAFKFGSSSVLTHSLNKLLTLKTDSGQELVHNIVVRPIVTESPKRCLLQVNDVTVAVNRERVLRDRQNARFHAIVDSAPDAIITTNSYGTIQWTNGAAERVFAYASGELIGRKIDVLLQAGSVAPQIFTDERTDATSSNSALQVIGRRKNGAAAWFEVSFAPWKADDRHFITTIWRDITERIASESALRVSEGRHRSLSEALPHLVWTCEPDGQCDYINPQWLEYSGGTSEDHRGWGWLNQIHGDDRSGADAAWERARVSGDVLDIEARLRRADGQYRWFKIRSIPVRASDESVSKWFGTATDITDLIEARESLRRSNEELEEIVIERTREREVALGQLHESQKMETIGQLTGGVAHDFNNLLAVILGSLTLLKKGLPNDPRTSRLLEGAIQGAERGATLTKRLLAFARRQELKLEAVEVQRLIPDILDFLRQSIGPSIAIILDIPADVHLVKIDANQLELALMNLAVNARDAMPGGGTLSIACRNEDERRLGTPSALPRGDFVRVSVTDTGEGMDGPTLAKAMEPFFTTKGLGKGTGLGLSMVHGLTAQCGGAMHISSSVGRGTTVSLWLPRAYENDFVSAPSNEMTVNQDSAVQRLRILLVDDDALVSTNTTYMLADLGHSVIEASSAKQALDVLHAGESFDLVITDYAMPGMNGLDLAMAVREARPSLPIILATGYAEVHSDDTRGFGRLAKPYTQDQLAQAVDDALLERRIESPAEMRHPAK